MRQILFPVYLLRMRHRASGSVGRRNDHQGPRGCSRLKMLVELSMRLRGTRRTRERQVQSPRTLLVHLEAGETLGQQMTSDPAPVSPVSKAPAMLSQTRRFSLTSTTSPGESIASSVASKETRTPSRTRLIWIIYSASSASFPAARAFTSSNRRAGPMARLDFTQALGRVLELS